MTGTLEEAFEQADAQLNNEEAEAVEETVDEAEDTSDKDVETTDEAPEPKSDDSSSDDEDNSESFTKVNPEELPEELKGVYKSLQADYTRKTQEVAEMRKKTDERVKRLEKQLEELSSQEEEEESKSQEPKSPEQQLKDVVKGEIEAEKVAEFREQAIADYESADPRLKLDSETYDKPTDLYVGQEMDARLAEHLDEGNPEYTFDYQSALKEVLSEWDDYVQNKQKAFLEEQSKKAKSKAKKTQKQNPKGRYGPGRPKKMSLDEAIQVAIQES